MGRRHVAALIATAVLMGCRALLDINAVTLGDPADGAASSSGGSGIPTSSVCSKDGFCWVNPLPQGNTLTSVYGRSETEVWAVGEGGTLIRFDGTTWKGTATPADVYTVVTGDGKGRLWIGGARKGLPVLLTSTDGTSWDVVATSTDAATFGSSITALWYDGQSTLWFGTDDGSVLSVGVDGQGLAQKRKLGAAVTSIAGRSGDQLLVTGKQGQVSLFRFGPISNWDAINQAQANDLFAVAYGSTAAYVGGASTLVEIASNGTSKSATFAKAPSGTWSIRGIAASGDKAWAVGVEGGLSTIYERAASGTWTRVLDATTDSGDGLVAVAPAGTRAWSVGIGGALAQYDGTKWAEAWTRRRLGKGVALLAVGDSAEVVGSSSTIDLGGPGTALAQGTVTGAALVGGETWIANGAAVQKRTGDAYATVAGVPIKGAQLLAATSATDVVAFGTDTGNVVGARFDGAWKTFPGAAPGTGDLTSAWAAGGTTYWLTRTDCSDGCGASAIRVSGDAYSDQTATVIGAAASPQLAVVWGPSATEVYFGGTATVSNKTVNLFQLGQAPVLLPRGGGHTADFPVTAIHGAGGDIWAGGAPRTVWHKTGGSWEARETGLASAVTAILVRAPGDVWITSDKDAVLHKAP